MRDVIGLREETRSAPVRAWLSSRINRFSASRFFNGVQDRIGLIRGKWDGGLFASVFDGRDILGHLSSDSETRIAAECIIFGEGIRNAERDIELSGIINCGG